MIYLVIATVLAGSIYSICDYYLHSVAKELMLSWIDTEDFSIQEGNLLTSITKTQRFLISSSYIKGVKLVKVGNSTIESKIEFGTPFVVEIQDLKAIDQQLYQKRIGFLHQRVFYQIPKKEDLVLVFDVKSEFLFLLFVFSSSLIIFLIVYLIWSLQKLEQKESKKREELLKIAVNGLFFDNAPSETLENEFPGLVKWWSIKKSEIETAKKASEFFQFQSALVNVASQVSHDIRSPLSALNMVIATFKDIPEEKRLIIRNAVQRINDIANELLQKSKETSAKQSSVNSPLLAINSAAANLKVHLLAPLIDDIVSEKRIQYRDKINVEITSDFSHSYGEFAEINANELKRVLSNLINNSVEAFADAKGKVMISIQSDKTTVSIVVRDNGKGIPPHILARLGEKGVTYGKEGTASGSGLGVYHAKKAIESFNGQFEILSKPSLGTTITMSFPKAAAPNWFVEKLVLSTNSQVIALDDDLSIHQIWKGRLQSLNAESFDVQLLSFTSGAEFKNYVEAQVAEVALQKVFLVDYELLNQNMTGLDLIEELGLGKSAILVTSRYEEDQIRNRCAKLRVKLIPKGMAGFVPIEIEKPKTKYDAILVDDDDLIHMTWQIVAKDKNKSIKLFKTEAEFLTEATKIDLSTPIYIDVNLANGVSGIDVAKRIHALGFAKLYLATGYAELEKPKFIEAVVGKDPQF